MDCATKDGLIIFLLIFSSVLSAIVIVLLIIFCRKRCCGGGAKRASPEEGGASSAKTNHHETSVNISRVGQAYPDNDSVHEERFVGEADKDDLQSGSPIKKSDGFFDLRDISGDQDDEHIYASAMEDNGSFTSYSSIRTYKSRHSLATVNNDIVEKISISSKASKMSSSSSSTSAYSAHQEVPDNQEPVRKISAASSSSSSTAVNSVKDISEVHEPIIMDTEPIYVNMEKSEEVYVGQSEDLYAEADDIYANVTKVSNIGYTQPASVDTKYKLESSRSNSVTINEPIISSPDSSDSESDDGDVIIAEHTAARETIEQEIANIIDKHMPILEYDLGNDIDWPKKINELEHEINMSERRFSNASINSDSNHFHKIQSSNINSYERPVSVMDNHKFQNRFSFDNSSGSSSSSVVEIESPIAKGDSLLDMEPPTFNSTELSNKQVNSNTNLPSLSTDQNYQISHQRNHSATSNSSLDSSSSSNSPSKTIAEVDLSIPLSTQIFTEVETQNSKGSYTQYMHGYSSVNGDLRGTNGYMYQIEEEASDKETERKIEIVTESDSSLSSDDGMENGQINQQFNNGHLQSQVVTKKATPVAYHSSEDNESPMVIRKATKVVSHSSDDNASPMIIKKATKIIDHSSDDNMSPMVIRKATPINHHSSDESDSPTLIKKATPIIHHSSDESDGSYGKITQMQRVQEDEDEDDDAFEDNELDLSTLIRFENGKEKPKIKPMRGSNSLNVPRSYDRMERISEASENAYSRSTSHQSSDDDLKFSSKMGHSPRNQVRRNSSGITSSSFISSLSADYESVYGKVEDAKRQSRAMAYRNVASKEEESAA